MKETQEILIKMGFKNPNDNVWQSDWFGVFILINAATPQDLAKFIYNRGLSAPKPADKETNTSSD